MNIPFHIFLQKHGLREKPIQSDNNCQFHAIVDQCLQNGIVGWNHISLRQASVQWLEKNKHKKFDDTPIHELFDLNDTHIHQLKQYNRVWGDEATLFAMAQILQSHIKVYSSTLCIHDIYPLFCSPKYTFHIGYFNNIHYISTIPCC